MISATKLDCRVIAIDAGWDSLLSFPGVVQLFEHRVRGFYFWYGFVEAAADPDAIKDLIQQRGDLQLRLRLFLDDGREGLATPTGLTIQRGEDFDLTLLAFVGDTQLATE